MTTKARTEMTNKEIITANNSLLNSNNPDTEYLFKTWSEFNDCSHMADSEQWELFNNLREIFKISNTEDFMVGSNNNEC